MRRSALPRRAEPASAILVALGHLTADDVDEEEVVAHGIARAVTALVRRTVVASGGYPSPPGEKHAAMNATTTHTLRLIAETLDVWEELDPAPEDVPPF